MTAPQRLIEADDEFERDLIRSAHDDQPSHRALERMLLGLSVELSKLPSAMSSSAAGATTGSKLGGAVLVKWLLSGVAIGLASMGGVEAVGRALEHSGGRATWAPKPAIESSPAFSASPYQRVPSAPRDGTLPVARPSSSAVIAAAPLRVAASAVLQATAAPSPSAPSPSPSVVSAARPPLGSFALEPAQAPPPVLAEEMHLLDSARRALADHDPRGTLSTLSSYERAFPNGALRPEASVLKVRALLAAGDRASAEALAQRVIENAPRSEHAGAVRAALGLRSNP